ncbi:iron ABC transporter permease [Biformimicrobium ophioploci]|uniref:Iron ABC transporter permease n=2 Tax=Biformimicrobium ophioploci TaxID=3036711 RepID=A0ABQ6M0Y8_9GAMM|nr:iron ABC transporter permease [Microbulbifer sp. NKW57]
MLVAMQLGDADISVWEGLLGFVSGDTSAQAMIVGEVRLPRVLLALFVGAALGAGGAAMQGLLRNPLAEPALLGVSSGAALGAILMLYHGLAWQAGFWLPASAMLGALLAVLLVWGLAGRKATGQSLILSGVAINALLSAAMALALNYAPSPFAMQEIIFWLLGSLSNRGWDQLAFAVPAILLGWALIWSGRHLLTGLSLGEDSATTLGVYRTPVLAAILLGLALSVGAAVAVAGTIGFVGLVVPHLVRPLVNSQPAPLVLWSGIGGALLLLLADMAVQALGGQQELRIGAVTALVGGPFFLWLILSGRGRF